jgi:hypothetical protein
MDMNVIPGNWKEVQWEEVFDLKYLLNIILVLGRRRRRLIRTWMEGLLLVAPTRACTLEMAPTNNNNDWKTRFIEAREIISQHGEIERKKERTREAPNSEHLALIANTIATHLNFLHVS